MATLNRILFSCLALLPVLLACPVPARASVPASATEVRAVFTFNFISFVDWPATAFASADAPLVIGVCGDAELADTLERVIAGEKVRGRPVKILQVKDAAGAAPCHILYAAAGHEEILSATRPGRPLLTLGESERFIAAGGIIRFVTERNRVRLQISLAPARAASLTISSQLLRIAEIVERPQ